MRRTWVCSESTRADERGGPERGVQSGGAPHSGQGLPRRCLKAVTATRTDLGAREGVIKFPAHQARPTKTGDGKAEHQRHGEQHERAAAKRLRQWLSQTAPDRMTRLGQHEKSQRGADHRKEDTECETAPSNRPKLGGQSSRVLVRRAPGNRILTEDLWFCSHEENNYFRPSPSRASSRQRSKLRAASSMQSFRSTTEFARSRSLVDLAES